MPESQVCQVSPRDTMSALAGVSPSFGVDQEDLYLETLNPGDPKLYKTRNGWAPMREEHETIRVRGAPDVPVVLHFTNHGPVVWATASGLSHCDGSAPNREQLVT